MKKVFLSFGLILSVFLMTSCESFLNYMANGPERATVTFYNSYKCQFTVWLSWTEEDGTAVTTDAQTLNCGSQYAFKDVKRGTDIKLCFRPYYYSDGSYEYSVIDTQTYYSRTWHIDYDSGQGGWIVKHT